MNKLAQFTLLVFVLTIESLFSQSLWRSVTDLPVDFPLGSNDSCLLESDGEDFFLLYKQSEGYYYDAPEYLDLVRIDTTESVAYNLRFDIRGDGFYFGGSDRKIEDFSVAGGERLWVLGDDDWDGSFFGTGVLPAESASDDDFREGRDVTSVLQQELVNDGGDSLRLWVVDSELGGSMYPINPESLWVRYRTPAGEFEVVVDEYDYLEIPHSRHPKIGETVSIDPVEIVDAFYGRELLFELTIQDLDSALNDAYRYYQGSDGSDLRIVEGNGVSVVSVSPKIDDYYYFNDFGRIYVSNDAESWVRSSLDGNYTVVDLVFENGIFAAVGSYLLSNEERLGMVAFSEDGQDWSIGLISGVEELHSVAWGGDRWFAGADDGVVYELDGEYWVPHLLSGVDSVITAITYANGHLAVGTATGDVYTTSDYSRWTHQVALAQSVRKLASTATHFACLSDSGFFVSPFAVEGAPDFVEIPPDQFVVPNENVTFSAEAMGEGEISYQWYRGQSGDDSQPIAGATSIVYITEPLLETAKYWVKASNSIGEDWSPTITLTMQTMPEITQHPSNRDYNVGTTTRTLVDGEWNSPTYVSGEGHNLSYQWFCGLSGDTSRPVTGDGRSIYLRSDFEGEHLYWVRVYNDIGSVDSRTALIGFVLEPAVFREQPADKTFELGSYESIFCSVDGSDLDYVWYGGETGDISNPLGVSNSSYSRRWEALGDYRFWVKVSNEKGFVDSRTVTVSVVPMAQPVIAREPTDAVVYADEAHSLSVSAYGYDLSYQWYWGESGDVSFPVGSAGSTLQVAPSFFGEYDYWVRISNSTGFVDSETTHVSIQQAGFFGITREPMDVEVYRSASTNALPLRVETAFSSESYQWYRGESGDRTLPIEDATASTYSPSISDAGVFQYWVEVSDGSSSSASRTAEVSVLSRPMVLTKPPLDESVMLNDYESLHLSVQGDSISYQWYAGQSGDVSNPIPNATSSFYAPSSEFIGTYEYWARLSNGDDLIDTRTIRYTVIAGLPFISSQPSDEEISLGSSAYLYVNARNSSDLSYEWFRGESGDTSEPVLDDTDSSLSLSNLQIGSHRYWVRVSNSYGFTDSETSTVNVLPNSYGSWATHHGLSTEEGLAGQSSSGDGISNLMKYAMGLNPWVRYESPFVTELYSTRDGDAFGIHVRVSNDLEGARLVVKESTDLSEWTTTAIEVGPRWDNGDGTFSTFYRCSEIGAAKGFLKLVVEEL
ncbi:MAG: hypothetical protein ACSHYA_00210 [Opitutaceae bacterium]